MKFYNTLSRKKEEFKPLRGKSVGFYACGPTVYDFAHIGNLRTYVFEDVLRRALVSCGYKVRHIMNLTDVDDKTIKNSQEKKEPLAKFTARYAKFFKEDIKKLNILPPAKFAPATAHIEEMAGMIQRLLDKQIAYYKDGSIYFSIKKFKNYGKLSSLDRRELKTGARVDVDEYSKENPADFALWRARTKKDGSVYWNTKLGKGRPGWHIECSAIAVKLLGQPFDIHAGGVDLIFPHHENEIAQAEAANGKKFARFWLHGEHLLVDNQKMAKSAGNFYTLADLEKRKISPLALRYFYLQAHYRSKLNFTWEALSAAENALQKIYSAARELAAPKIGCAELENKFKEAIDDDLNTPEALAVLWELLKSDNPPSAKAETLLKFDEVLGLDIKKYLGKKIKPPKEVLLLVKKREAARETRDWKTADELRKQVKKLGFEIEDTAGGPKLEIRN